MGPGMETLHIYQKPISNDKELVYIVDCLGLPFYYFGFLFLVILLPVSKARGRGEEIKLQLIF